MPYRESAKEPPNRFDAEMAKCTDEELLAIVNGPAAGWEPEAIEAARLELEVRDLTRDEQRELVESFEEAREARAPIEPSKVAIALVAGVVAGIVGYIVMLAFDFEHRRLGHTDKRKEMRSWYFFGLGIHVCIVLLLSCR